jgi:hypothetical protein
MKKISILLLVSVLMMVVLVTTVSADSTIVGKWQRTDGFDIYDYFADGTGTAVVPTESSLATGRVHLQE